MLKGKMICVNNTGDILYAFGKNLVFSGYTYNKKHIKENKNALASTLAFTKITSTSKGPIMLLKIPVN